MPRALRAAAVVVSVVLAVASGLPLGEAFAFTTPFHFHCRGNACRVVNFADEGNGCTVAQNVGSRNVHVTQGPFYYDLAPGEVHAEITGPRCAGYYDGGETATFY